MNEPNVLLGGQPTPASPPPSTGLSAELEPGKCCPTCERRIPYPKKPSSPKSLPVPGYRVPEDEQEAHQEVMEAAARHLGVFEKPHWRFKLNSVAYALVLQDENLKSFFGDATGGGRGGETE